MRILYLAKYYWPRAGGMERVVQGLAEGVAERGHEAEVVAITSFGATRPGLRRRASVTRAWSFAPVGSQELAPGYIRAAWRRADVIHLHHPHSLADIAYASRVSLAPLVVTQHADSPAIKYRLPSKYVLWRAEAIVVPSRAHIALCSELRGFEDKVEVIPFGVDERRWELVPPPPPGSPPRAIFIGRLAPYKGVDFLLRALERVPELRLDIVGMGPEYNRLRTLSRALAVDDRVKWWGEYPDEDLPRRMADADFLVLPSVTVEEMFGMARPRGDGCRATGHHHGGPVRSPRGQPTRGDRIGSPDSRCGKPCSGNAHPRFQPGPPGAIGRGGAEKGAGAILPRGDDGCPSGPVSSRTEPPRAEMMWITPAIWRHGMGVGV